MIRGDNHLVLDNMRDDYPDLVQWVRDHGRPAKPNGKLTHELRSVNLTLLDPLDSLPFGTGAKGNPESLAVAEALQLISGTNEFALMSRIGVGTPGFSVGERIAGQLDGVAKALQLDGQTRQALASVWDPAYDRGTFRPCTLTLQFFWREEKLELHVNVRSLDVVVAPTENIFPLAQLQITMARFLGTNVGNLELHVGSLHMRASDSGVLDLLHKTEQLTRPADVPLGIGDGSEQLWEETAARAKFVLDVATGRIVDGVNVNAFSETEKWYLERLRPFWTPGG